ncbi:MAG TPA: DUF4097 family beta strand repeat-containing protein [Candidatus Sulfomarinibacteraceae bacterium]|nr:DUF4097 family beta strand repeat-containing protein [Candidatus Sulfomarinibacteraceae bacterium]
MRSLTLVVASLALIGAAPSTGAAELHEEHSFAARPGQTVVVDVSVHRVEVRVRPSDTVHAAVDISVGGSSRKAERLIEVLRPVFEDRGDDLIIRSVRSGGWGWYSGSIRGEVTITMPPNLDLQVDSSSGSILVDGDLGSGSVVCDASSGSVTVRGAMRNLHVETSSGSIRAEVDRPLESFTADASSGSIRLDGGARTAAVETSSGGITLANLLGDAQMSASSGGIEARWDAIPPGATITASASSGGVELRLPAGTDLDGVAETSSGSIRSDFPGTYDHDEIRFAGGPDAVRVGVDTSSGNVSLSSN